MKKLMLRVLSISTGAVTFGLLAHGLVSVAAYWYGPRYIKSDADIGDAFMVALCILLLAALVGGFFGNKVFKRWVTRNAK
jgi:hypothetical protein